MPQTLSKIRNVAGEFRRLERLFPLSYMEILLLVAERPGIHSSEIARELDLSPTTVSIGVSTLGDKRRDDRPGLQMLSSKVDPARRSVRRISLTPKGERFIADIREQFAK